MFNLKNHTKKDKNAFSISKFLQKKAKMKKESTFFGIFGVDIPCALLLHYKRQNSPKKEKNAEKFFKKGRK